MQRVRANLARNLRLGGIRRNACTQSRRLITGGRRFKSCPRYCERPWKRGLSLLTGPGYRRKLCPNFCLRRRWANGAQLVRPQDGGRDELSNLATLCGGCHRLTHKAMTASQRQRFSGRRVVHPTSISPDPLGLEYLPIEGKTVRAPKMGVTKTIRTRGSSGGPKQPNGMHTRWHEPGSIGAAGTAPASRGSRRRTTSWPRKIPDRRAPERPQSTREPLLGQEGSTSAKPSRLALSCSDTGLARCRRR
jgi:hypothetical protein